MATRPVARTPPTGPMVRLLRRLAAGAAVPASPPAPSPRSPAAILQGLVARGLIVVDERAGGPAVCRLTDAGRAVLARCGGG